MIIRGARSKAARTTLLSASHSRFYSRPSKPANAPAFAAHHAHQDLSLPFFNTSPSSSSTTSAEMASFLTREGPYSVLPPPLPTAQPSAATPSATTPEPETWYTDTQTQDLLAVINACLHNLYDVQRAKSIFDRMRERPNHPGLDTRVYNAFIHAYINMATTKDPGNREYWVEGAWELYETMKTGDNDRILPNAGTYAALLVAWVRFNPDTNTPVHTDLATKPSVLLATLVERGLSVEKVVAHPFITSDEEAAQLVRMLTKVAYENGMSKTVAELTAVESVGSSFPDVLEGVPDVRPVELERIQKDETNPDGPPKKVSEMPFNLSNLRKHLSQITLARRVLPEDLVARQKLIEDSVYDVARQRLQHEYEQMKNLEAGKGQGLKDKRIQRWMWEWHMKLRERIGTEIKNITAFEKKNYSYGRPKAHLKYQAEMISPYLALVNAERLSLLTIMELMTLHDTGGVTDGMKTARAVIAVGKAVEAEYKAQMCKRNHIAVPSSTRSSDISVFSNLGYSNLQERRVAAARLMEDGEAWTAPWSVHTRARVGGVLIDCLMDTAKVQRTAVDKKDGKILTEEQPAFYHSYEYVQGQRLGVIKLNQEVAAHMANEWTIDTVHPRHLPMLVKPKPWLNYNDGGYLYHKTYAMRFKGSREQQAYLKHASDAGQCELVYAGLDVLGSTPWKINRKIFDVVLEVWNRGDRWGKLPPATFDEPEPDALPPDADSRKRADWSHAMKLYNQAKQSNHSHRCSVNYKIEIARTFLGETFYQPHNLDFRGRAYPVPPHLNHIGDDLSRGLLMFAEKKPLGERGFRWLKIHIANLYGFDKASFDERVQWVEDRLADVYDSANNPINGKRWWLEADDPWQCLAASMELRDAIESGDPLAFESSLPVHQDGTCNGLQHYAALGGDPEGAAQVNLQKADRPSDVYTYVGRMVERIMEEDEKKGDPMAILLKGKISRKVVKQTVMTTVYGVTFIGARDQIERQLRDRKDIPPEHCWGAATYLARKVLACIGDLFYGAKHIMTWLNLCARLIAKSIPMDRLQEMIVAENEQAKAKQDKRRRKDLGSKHKVLKREQMTSVVWTTPMGLPIAQPYRKATRKQVKTALQTVLITDPNSLAEVNSSKQATAFPPNFIHSLDATHMMLTALECRQQGLTFASVHDSYWTHACSIDQMSGIIRDTFIALHSSDVLMRLHKEFLTRYANYKIPLISLGAPKFMRDLRAAGARIYCTPEQAEKLQGIRELLEVSETATPTVDESKAQDTVQSLLGKDAAELDDKARLKKLADMLNGESAKTTKKAAEDEDDVEVEDPTEDVSSVDKQAMVDLLGKFVNLTDILPPLPPKGTFRVEDIKESPYFFS
ncbi:DNA/RNA polymerase [Schizophyllum commune Loenen D]|nr:DNA/RNA polymerase [Schizophyllum commune Loenen D]